MQAGQNKQSPCVNRWNNTIYLFICGTSKHFGRQMDPDSLDREEYEIIVCSPITWFESSVLCEQFQSDKGLGSLLGGLQSYMGHSKQCCLMSLLSACEQGRISAKITCYLWFLTQDQDHPCAGGHKSLCAAYVACFCLQRACASALLPRNFTLCESSRMFLDLDLVCNEHLKF